MPNKSLEHLADLHMHLGSATTTHLLWEIAHQRGINLQEKNYWRFLESMQIDAPTDYHTYLRYFDVTENVQSSPDAVERSVYEAISLSYRKANISLLELRFNPMNRNREGLYDLDRIIFSAVVGMKKAAMIYPIKVGLILSMDRRMDERRNRIIVEKAIKFRNEGVVGIDLAGPLNKDFNFQQIQSAVENAKSHGLGVTIHTGEATGADEMWDVLKYINPNRIGHGIHCVDDEKLMEEIVKRDICLEICPTSNLTTSVVKNWQEMSQIINTIKSRGIQFTINSDGPVLLQTNIKMEAEKLIENNVLTLEEILNSVKTSQKYSFIS